VLRIESWIRTLLAIWPSFCSKSVNCSQDLPRKLHTLRLYLFLRLRGSRENCTPSALLTSVALCPSAHKSAPNPTTALFRNSNHSLVISHARSPGIVVAILICFGREVRACHYSREVRRSLVGSLKQSHDYCIGRWCGRPEKRRAVTQATEARK
jgi:hypothetical protein